uniref:hypothetical protein n=1 Tax=Verrucomicrobium sp. BvORR106 TaxID=1403819 RepID=UPI00056DA62C
GGGGGEGEVVEAFVSVAALNRRVRMMPNQLGEYPRIWMGDAARAEVTLVFQDAAPGTPVALAAQDGGKFTGQDQAALLTAVDAQQRVSFAFDVSSNPGVHRVTTRTPGGDVKLLEFWAGEAPAIQTAAR